jgi:hypothetical protein
MGIIGCRPIRITHNAAVRYQPFRFGVDGGRTGYVGVEDGLLAFIVGFVV